MSTGGQTQTQASTLDQIGVTGRLAFGPEMATVTYTGTDGGGTIATPTPGTNGGAAKKPDVQVEFKGTKGTGPIEVDFGLPAYSPVGFNLLRKILVVAIPSTGGAALPMTPTDWINNPTSYVGFVDTSAILGGGTATVTLAGLPQATYICKAILEFDA